jgi:hypothetical protein
METKYEKSKRELSETSYRIKTTFDNHSTLGKIVLVVGTILYLPISLTLTILQVMFIKPIKRLWKK